VLFLDSFFGTSSERKHSKTEKNKEGNYKVFFPQFHYVSFFTIDKIRIEEILQSTKTTFENLRNVDKNIHVLLLSSELCHEIIGVHAVCCKVF